MTLAEKHAQYLEAEADKRKGRREIARILRVMASNIRAGLDRPVTEEK
jgi:ribosomal protein L29